ncbi:response regulator [Marivivens donghaensis]|uniref:Response regulator n=1 Tax=Marivivens donghaensis TaxID=1699413 RepID=A0ABX0W1G7_9RHOB|nr:response regulator [Marivivens donghaensis]NIY73830.1 response regulator [Marivivens donghaensis]
MPNFSRDLDVLILEDEALISFDLELLISSCGAKSVVCAFDIEQAREALAQQTFDIAVLDLNLPDGESTVLVPDLRKTNTAIVFHSGHAERADLMERYPYAEFTAKPAAVQTFKSAFVTALAKAQGALPTAEG